LRQRAFSEFRRGARASEPPSFIRVAAFFEA
jgi:hypothetical protein